MSIEALEAKPTVEKKTEEQELIEKINALQKEFDVLQVKPNEFLTDEDNERRAELQILLPKLRIDLAKLQNPDVKLI